MEAFRPERKIQEKINIDMDIGNINVLICIPGLLTFCHTNLTYKSVIFVFLKIVLESECYACMDEITNEHMQRFLRLPRNKTGILSYFLAKLKYVEILH